MSVAVISAVYGDYDTPIAPPEQSVEADWILVSDREHVVDGWRQVIEPRAHMHPRLAAKVPKCRPDLYSSADVLIWVDGSLMITSGGFVEWCIASLGDHQMAQFFHPERSSIVSEAIVSAGMAKYAYQSVGLQAAHYITEGHPENWGLWATGLIVRDQSCHRFGDAWLREQPLLRGFGIDIANLKGGSIWRNPYFTIRPHASDR
jgi:hypothetical protein